MSTVTVEAPNAGQGPGGIDFLNVNGNGFQANGSIAQRLLQSGGDWNSLRTNAVLMRDEWIAFDREVVDITRENLVAVAEVMNRGLVMNLPNAIGTLTLEWQEILDDLVEAEVSMSGLVESTKDRLSFGTRAIPIPIIHKEFFYNLRFLEAARRHGRAVDTEHAAIATRKVAEKVEGMLFNGLAIAQNTGVIYGLLNHPHRNTGSGVNFASATGEQIVTQVIAMLNTMAINYMNGPFVVFIPLTAAAHLGEDYKAASDRTIWERLMAIPQIAAGRIVATPKLTGTTVVLVQMTRDVVRMIDGLQPTMVEWETRGGWEFTYKIVAILLPQIRSSGNQKSGIVHYA
jgi:uncharacterized linocin/CFP29 family protein